MAEQSEQDQKKARYLRAISRSGTLTAGCKAAKVSPHTVYQWREMDDAFVFAEREAKDSFADALEEEAVRRAWHGVRKPVYTASGRLAGHVTEYSDSLLMFSLKAIRPDKYRDRIGVEHSGSINTDTDLDTRIAARLAEVATGSQSTLALAPGSQT